MKKEVSKSENMYRDRVETKGTQGCLGKSGEKEDQINSYRKSVISKLYSCLSQPYICSCAT